MISKVLVANRGEIARRIFRTCREMGISTVAIYSDVDAGEPHMREADEAVLIPGEAPDETYLNIDAVMSAAKETAADAIHPGYGFLAENPAFATAVEAAGVIWVGPSPRAIEIMGSKLESKRLMEEVGVPVLPGVALAGLSAIQSAAVSLGLPVVVKASAGGGGKGMRVVHDADHLSENVDAARREAIGAFGDGTLFLEKYLTEPRHIEIQVLGDREGTVISLFERECSIQRRHQKIIEEAPSPAIDEATRMAMGEAAVRAARAVDYVGAGTVEFLYQNGEFFFLEMNTRLQVEHPVTEMVTGLDLVRLQFEVANGEKPAVEASTVTGHAIEARLYAEDPLNDYLPVTGTFHHFEFPEMEGLRVDTGIEDGSMVSVHYDPLLAKVIAHAPTREGAATLLSSALRHARVHGSTTNRALLVRILEHPEFIAGEIDTHFLERHDLHELAAPLLDEGAERLAALAAALSDQAYERASAKVLTTIPSGWRNSSPQVQHRDYSGQHGTHHIEYSMRTAFSLEGVGSVTVGRATPSEASIVVGDLEHDFEIGRYGERRYVDSVEGPGYLVEIPRFAFSDNDEKPGSLHAPMPGRVIKIGAQVGDRVSEGHPLMVIEAMKMEHTLRSPRDGTVTQVLCSAGDQVEADAVLVVVE
ncbi:MAG: acetyl/propionyl/methylcrotonyl-CoA carboxylase subunit alpha, partial [Acidimicrobiia bacterium]